MDIKMKSKKKGDTNEASSNDSPNAARFGAGVS